MRAKDHVERRSDIVSPNLPHLLQEDGVESPGQEEDGFLQVLKSSIEAMIVRDVGCWPI